MTLSLSPADVAVILLFVGLILALGFSAKLRDSGAFQFLTAGRALTLPVFVATLVSTWYGGILGIGESVGFYGIGTWLLLGVPYYVFAAIYAIFFAKKVRNAEEITLPELLADRFGRTSGLVAAGLVFLLAVPAAHVLMLGTLTELITGWPHAVSIVVAGVVGSLFLYRGGLLADVRIGAVAFIAMYLGFLVIVGWCLTYHPWPETAVRLQAKGRMDFLGGQGPLAILSFFILGAWTLVDPGFHQRVASCKDAATGQRGVFWAIGCWFVFDVLTITAGLYGLDLLKPQPASGLQLFPALGNQVLPPGLKGLFLCGLIGTLLSAFVGYLLVSGGTFGREIVARLQPKASAGLWSRIGIGVGLCVAIPLALSVESVVALWYSWAGAVVGALLIPVAIAYLAKNRRIGAPWVAASMILSFAVAFGWLIAGLRTNNPFLEVSMMGQKFGLGTLVPGVVVSAAVLGIGALASKKELEQ